MTGDDGVPILLGESPTRPVTTDSHINPHSLQCQHAHVLNLHRNPTLNNHQDYNKIDSLLEANDVRQKFTRYRLISTHAHTNVGIHRHTRKHACTHTRDLGGREPLTAASITKFYQDM